MSRLHDTHEVAWAGGLFEGEGSFVASRVKRNPTRTYVTVTAVISMTDLEPLERFQAAVGFGNIDGPYEKAKPNHSDFWRWIVRGREGVIDLLALLEPYLTDRRVGRAIELILQDTKGRERLSTRQEFPDRTPRSVVPPACPHGHVFDKENTYIAADGRYQCRTCKRDAERLRKQRLREEHGPQWRTCSRG